MKGLQRFREDDLHGVHYALNIFLATTVLWLIVKGIGDSNPIWATSSMVATSDPQMKQSIATFRGRIINTLLGCAIGLLFIALGHTDWQLPTALALAVLVSTYGVKVQNMWRQAPITAAIVIAGNLQHHDKLQALERGGVRVGEVLFGCVVGIGTAWVLSKLWPLPPKPSGSP